MASASLSLPPPRNAVLPKPSQKEVSNDEIMKEEAQVTKITPRAPSYEERCRTAQEAARLPADQRPKLFCPRALQDFDDGGAFPEIHVAQYPRHMGNPHLSKQRAQQTQSSTNSVRGVAQTTSRAIVNVQVDDTGEISYDAIVKRGTNADKKVYSRLEDVRGHAPEAQDIALPTAEEEEEETARTQAALMGLVQSKTALDKPKGSAMVNAATSQNQQDKTQFIKYTPNPNAPGYNPAAAQRIIQMVPAQIDPMMPPKHKHLKAPRGPAEDPVPVLHAPPPKLSKEEREQWNIPSCISNWKNSRGFTIPLDKRLAADGRGLREHSINPNFSTLSESLYVAERQARQEVRMRAQVQKKMALQDKEKREEDLRNMANQARMERGGHVARPSGTNGADKVQVEHASDLGEEEEESEDQVAARQRDRLRMDRKREREQELRLESNMELKKKKMEDERDVSEKIALGVHGAAASGSNADNVDARLYSQSAGMDSGFGPEDEYNTYSKPLFGAAASSSSIYRPTRGETEYNADEQYDKLVKGSTSKFVPDKGFAGAESGGDVRAGPRNAPVQFEKGKQK
jgi:SNW domain-containing protein 1